MSDNRARAVYWYKEALKRDPACYEVCFWRLSIIIEKAFERLIDNSLLTQVEEINLMKEIQFDEEWLKLLYESKVNKVSFIFKKNYNCLV